MAGGDLDDLRESHRTFRIVYAEAPPDEEIQALRELSGVREVEREGRGVRLGVRGDVETVRRALQARPHEVRDVDSMGMSLEDIFVAYVEEDRDAR